MPPIRYDDAYDGASNAERLDGARRYESPGRAGLTIEPIELAGRPCSLARADADGAAADGAARGMLIVLDGARLLRRIGRSVERGDVDAGSLPWLVGIDPADVLTDYTPWRQPAFKPGAPDFGGGADAFLSGTVLPVAHALRGRPDMPPEGPLGLLGYSLAALFSLGTLLSEEAAGVFDRLLIASPSAWYPGFVDRIARTPFASDPRVVIACGVDEGADHPEPVCGTRQETDRLVVALTAGLSYPPQVIMDREDHHKGLTRRLETLLAAW